MNEGRSVLVIEDDRAILKLLRDVFQAEGLQVHAAGTARLGLVEAGSRHPDIIVLDLGLPDLDGKEFLRELRGWSQVPVLVLTARSAESEKVEVLDLGADDYLTKPFGVPELLARLRALLRRVNTGVADLGPHYGFGQVMVDLQGRTVTRGGALVHLTDIEFRLLAALVKAEGRIVTQASLLREVWGPGQADQTHYLRIYMGHLRKKLEENPAEPAWLITEIGVGCRCLCERRPVTG
ncbi:MAG: two component system transcriptional regulatory protein [Fibrobacterota bacterium]|jgi:two-component system KDP operon response regulator KdpE